MDDRDASPLAWLAALLGRLAVLAQVLLLLIGIGMVFYGLWFSHCKQRAAQSWAEMMYWRLRWWGFATGSYAIVVFFWSVLYRSGAASREDPVLYDYWPAVCMLWTDDSWFGGAGHALAVSYDAVFMGAFACAIAASACLFGTWDRDCDDFTPT
jgi:hypothetical protein